MTRNIPLKLSSALIAEIKHRGLVLVRGIDSENFLELADTVSEPSWPEFMLHDSVANRHWYDLNDKYAPFQFALAEQVSGQWIAVGNSLPVFWSGALEELPDTGWDWALAAGIASENPPNFLCALAIQILPRFRGGGLSALIVQIMKEIGHSVGLNELIAPVRPNKKCDYPLTRMKSYIEWSSGDERFDPWLRVHERLGARIIKICPQAMEIIGTIAEWQEWTGLSFQTSGQYVIPGGLVPLEIDIASDRGSYIEPNVWLVHKYKDPTT